MLYTSVPQLEAILTFTLLYLCEGGFVDGLETDGRLLINQETLFDTTRNAVIGDVLNHVGI